MDALIAFPAMIIQSLKAIPGIPFSYVPEEGHQVIIALYEIVKDQSKFLLKIFLLASFGMALFASERFPFSAVIRQTALALLLFLAIPLIFGSTLKIGIGFANKIYPEQKAAELSKSFDETAKDVRDERAKVKEGTWVEKILMLVSSVVPGPSQASAVVMLLSSYAFFLATVGLNVLWTLIAIILFVLSPIFAVAAAVPGWGGKLAANWFGAVVQLAALRVWLAICAFMVDNASILFMKSSIFSFEDITNRFAATAATFIFTLLFISGPFVVNRLIPLSSINASVVEPAYSVGQFVARQTTSLATRIVPRGGPRGEK